MEATKATKRPFTIDYEGAVDERLPLKVFVFDGQQKLIESQDVSKDGTFHLKTEDHLLRHAQVFIAPVSDAIALNPQPLPPQLEAIGAYRPVLQFDKNRLVQRDLLPIPDALWQKWRFCSCRVRGRVVKPFYIPRFPFGLGRGFTINMPVCHARVHICRLESRIHLLRDAEIFKLRDDLLRYRLPEIPRPPRPGDPVPFVRNMAMMEMEIAAPQMKMAATDATAIALSTNFQSQLQTPSAGALRQILADNIFEYQYHPRFCWFYDCVEIAVVETDANGYFDARVWESCFAPNHNYYLSVEYLIDGVWQSVYAPTYCRGAFWNYICGTSITISVTDSRVPIGCRPTQTGSFFEVVSIGSGAHVSHIKQKANPSVVLSDTDDIGLIDMAYGDGDASNSLYLSPFGGSLTIRANTGAGFPSANATHYRCIYKKSSDPDVPSSWKSVNNGAYSRPYNEEIELTPGGLTKPFPNSYPLHESGTEFYKLTHENPTDDLVPLAKPIVNRTWERDTYDIATLNTSSLENTHYDIRIEIYKKNTNGTYTLTTVAKEVFLVPDPINVGAVPIAAPANLLTTVTVGGISAYAFQMTIRVDNQVCSAAIDNASVLVNGAVRNSDTACGMLNYGELKNVPLTVGFHAQHPNNFAWFGFTVSKGNSGSILSTAGQLTDIPTGFSNTDNDGGAHRHHFESVGLTAADFLGACNAAAFAENLTVAALATDGSTRLNGYDASSTAAFAMIP